MERSRRTAFVLFALAISASSVRAAYAPGCTVALDIPGAVNEANAVAIQPDGKIVVAGYADFGGNRDFLVARFHPDLSLDTSFNFPNGYRVHDLSAGLNDEAFAVVVQFDQKIVVGGYWKPQASKEQLAFVRYNRDGSLDTGLLWDIFPSNIERVRGLAIQPDGKILGAGFTTPGGNQQLVVVRLMKDVVTRDTSFGGGDGIETPAIGGNFSFGTGVVVQPDGKIVVSGEVGFTTIDFLAVRLNPNGSLDTTSFNNPNGWVATDIRGNGDSASSVVVLQPNKEVVLAGTTDLGLPSADVAVVRYRENGTLDTSFGGTGLVVHNFNGSDTGNALTLDSGGNLLVAGANGAPDFAFARIRPAGPIDLSKTDDISGMEDRAFGIAVTRAGKILVVGSSRPATSLQTTLSLYKSDGTQDCALRVEPVDVFTTGSSGDSTNGQVMLNWLNPSYGPYDRTVIRRDATACPGTPADGVTVASLSDGLGNPGSFVDTVPLGPTYFYAAFVLDSGGQPSTGVCRSAAPFDRTAGRVEWKYDTSISALTTPGLRVKRTAPVESVVYTVSNDGLVHAIRGGRIEIGGGSWPPNWKPFLIGGPAQARPPVVPLPAPWSYAVLLGSQDGRAYAIDAFTGALIWRSAILGENIQAGPAAELTALGGTTDLVFVATRNTGQPNRIYALDAKDGAVDWFFDNGGGLLTAIGEIMNGASVDYAAHRVYFTSFLGASSMTTWCLDYSVSLPPALPSTPPVVCGTWPAFGVNPQLGGDIEASPILYQSNLFVSDISPGDLYAVNPANGGDSLVVNLDPGGVKGFVFPRYPTDPNLFASTSLSTYSVDFSSIPGAASRDSCVTTPTTPTAVPGTDWVFVGSNEGKLFQYNASTIGGGCPVPSACIGNCASTVGAPAYDVLRSMLYAGTLEGSIYGVRAPNIQPW